MNKKSILISMLVALMVALLAANAGNAAVRDKGEKDSEYAKSFKLVAQDGVFIVEPDFKKSKFYPISEEAAKETHAWGSALDMGDAGILLGKNTTDNKSTWICLFNGKEWKCEKHDKLYQGFWNDEKKRVLTATYDQKTGQQTSYEVKVEDGSVTFTETKFEQPSCPGCPIEIEIVPQKAGIQAERIIEVEKADRNQIAEIEVKDIQRAIKVVGGAAGNIQIIGDCRCIMPQGWHTQQSSVSGEQTFELQQFFENQAEPVVREKVKFRIVNSAEKEKALSEFEVKQGNEKEGYFSHFSYFGVNGKDTTFNLIYLSYRVENNVAVYDLNCSVDSGKTWNTDLNGEWKGRQLLLVVGPKS